MNAPATPLRALIADDERLMREQLQTRLQQAWPELDIVGAAREDPVVDEHFAKVFNLDESLGDMLGNPGVLARLARYGIRAALGRRRVPFGFDRNAEPPATDYSTATA